MRTCGLVWSCQRESQESKGIAVRRDDAELQVGEQQRSALNIVLFFDVV